MKKNTLQLGFRKSALALSLVLTVFSSSAQTNVYDDVIAGSANHTSLKAALDQEGLDVALQTGASLTVFAPDNMAFDNLATALNTDINGLLALPNLSDILLYHVLGVTVDATSVTNGDIVDPLNTANTIKMTKTSTGSVYANQAMVNGADLSADNGIVHSVDAVLLPYETVVDVAIDNMFTTLTTAVITAELLPALTDPLASLTVFAPDNTAFDNLVADLGIDLNGLLALPELADILLYHVVNGAVLSNNLTAGSLATLNGQDVQVDLTSGVMINSSNVTLPNVTADNGVVHVIDAVLVPSLAGIGEEKIELLEVSPNPTSKLINIKNSTDGDYQILNVNGATVQSGTLENGTIDVSQFPKGNYFIKIINETEAYQGKFIKL
jgi:uncharacterized surface protein with fasciclin (FAS1) repeats